MMKRTVCFVSDGTGITAETLGYSLITQFEGIDFTFVTIPYVDSVEKAELARSRIENIRREDKQPPLIFATLVNPDVRDVMAQSQGLYLDFFSTFIDPLEAELKTKSSYTIGRTHGVHSPKDYKSRIDAINYTLSTDDGTNIHQYKQAEVILVGVSRSGKTPTSLYLSLQFGLRAANYPITEEDMTKTGLPEALQSQSDKLFGLTIDTHRLQAIRNERRPGSRYASLGQCQKELKNVENMFKKERIPYLNTTNLSIEEIGTQIMQKLGLERRQV